MVKDKLGWGKEMLVGKGMGFVVYCSFLIYVVCVVEVEVDDNNNIKILMVYFVVDCGVFVNFECIKV